MERGVRIKHDLERTPLQIKTNSEVGSNKELAVYFQTADGDDAGGLLIYFKGTIHFWISSCSESNSNFPSDLPSEADKIWKIILTRTSGIRLVISCNNVEVVNVVLSDTTCDDNVWSSFWKGDIETLSFPTWDSASDFYGAGKRGQHMAT